MREPLMYTLYKAKAVLQDFNETYFPADPDDLATQLERTEERIEELAELQSLHDQISAEMSRITQHAKSEMDFARLQEAAAVLQEDTSAMGYFRVAEYFRRLMILQDM